jgi:hypothetical protein
VVTVRSEAAISPPTWANVIVILMTVRLDVALGHVAARANVILTLPFRVDPHTSSDGHLFRVALANPAHAIECQLSKGARSGAEFAENSQKITQRINPALVNWVFVRRVYRTACADVARSRCQH